MAELAEIRSSSNSFSDSQATAGALALLGPSLSFSVFLFPRSLAWLGWGWLRWLGQLCWLRWLVLEPLPFLFLRSRWLSILVFLCCLLDRRPPSVLVGCFTFALPTCTLSLAYRQWHKKKKRENRKKSFVSLRRAARRLWVLQY